MKQGLTRNTLAFPGFIELTKDDYAALTAAKRGLVSLVGIEEKWDLVVENYADYERTLFELALDQVLDRPGGWSSFRSDIQLLNRRIANLLSATRLYTDQVTHDVSNLPVPDSDALQIFVKQSLEAEYDAHLSYRTMEALRNHVQHFALPVHVVRHSMTRVDTNESDRHLLQ
jgi:hypothetical protein